MLSILQNVWAVYQDGLLCLFQRMCSFYLGLGTGVGEIAPCVTPMTHILFVNRYKETDNSFVLILLFDII